MGHDGAAPEAVGQLPLWDRKLTVRDAAFRSAAVKGYDTHAGNGPSGELRSICDSPSSVPLTELAPEGARWPRLLQALDKHHRRQSPRGDLDPVTGAPSLGPPVWAHRADE